VFPARFHPTKSKNMEKPAQSDTPNKGKSLPDTEFSEFPDFVGWKRAGITSISL
jgi:hypothetical protein